MKKTRKRLRRELAPRKIRALKGTGVDVDTVMSIICNNLDKQIGHIIRAVEEQTKVQLNRAQPYELLRRAAQMGRLHYMAPLDAELALRLTEEHQALRRARVVNSLSVEDVARHAALLLRDFVEKWERTDLHMGVAGGELMAETIRQWAELVKILSPSRLALKRLFIHALVAASDDPRRSPNGFVQWILDELPVETFFVPLPAPALMKPASLKAFRGLDGIRQVFERAAELDIIVTSAGAHWATGCSGLNQKYRGASPGIVEALEDAGCIGDIMWQPFGHHGPINFDAVERAVTLVDLKDLPARVASGMRLMVVLAPCGGTDCRKSKHEMLRALLNWPGVLTDVVVDRRTAMQALER